MAAFPILRLTILAFAAACLTGPSGALAEGMGGIDVYNAKVSVCFRPGIDSCRDRILNVIDSARATIKLQAYSLTQVDILAALRRAIKRGVRVEAILDQRNARKKNAAANYLFLAGAEVWIDEDVGQAHNKLILVDGVLSVGGSYNYSANAEYHNAENVTFMLSSDLYLAFARNWEERREKSTRYTSDY